MSWMYDPLIRNFVFKQLYMDVSENSGTPKSSILIEFSIINYKPSILGETPLFLETPI